MLSLRPLVALSFFALAVSNVFACSGGDNPIQCSGEATDCSCYALSSDDKVTTSVACHADAAEGVVCCADDEWPSRQATCRCSTDFNGSCGMPKHSVDSCGDAVGPSSSDGGSGDAGGSDSGSTCTSGGACGPSEDSCNCGICLHVGEGSYTCGTPCDSDKDCVGKTGPGGKEYTACSPGYEGEFDYYDGLCY